MLARMIVALFLLGLSAIGVDARVQKPNVFVILTENKGPLGADRLSLEGAADVYQSTLKVSPGRAAVSAALMYGMEALRTGVVHVRDWRRKAVSGDSVMDGFRKAGYSTLFCGTWRLGAAAPFDAASRGFDNALTDPAGRLVDVWGTAADHPVAVTRRNKQVSGLAGKGRPLFCFIDEPIQSTNKSTADMVQQFAASQWEKQKRPTLAIVIFVDEARAGKEGEPRYFDTVGWSAYSWGAKLSAVKQLSVLHSVSSDADIAQVLQHLTGVPLKMNQGYHFFHKAGWPASVSADKFRHQGSLVMGKGYALVDGLDLYLLTENKQPDFSHPLDIAQHQKSHLDLLTAYSRWWMGARKAIHDPRAYWVGEEDKKPTMLTAMDWRPSKILHPDGTHPSFREMIYQKDLLQVLASLRDEKFKQRFPAYSGSWAVRIMRAGRYKITARLLPKEANEPGEKALAKLEGGQAFVRLGNNQVQLNLIKGATSVSVFVDADAGVKDLECWFTGQLALERELGAFFVEIERVGDKKYDLKAR